MKKKTRIGIIFVVVILLILFCLRFWIIPKVVFNKKYTISNSLTSQETVEQYFKCLDDKNPGAANAYLENPTLDAYCCNTVISVNIKSIDQIEKVDYPLDNYYDTAQYFVKFECNYFLGLDYNQIFFGMSDCANYYLVKETKDSNWKIHSWGLG